MKSVISRDELAAIMAELGLRKDENEALAWITSTKGGLIEEGNFSLAVAKRRAAAWYLRTNNA
jgi:hypothetical protein